MSVSELPPSADDKLLNLCWVNSLYATENYNHPLYAIGPTCHRHKKNPPHAIQWHTRDELYFSMAFRELTLYSIDLACCRRIATPGHERFFFLFIGTYAIYCS